MQGDFELPDFGQEEELTPELNWTTQPDPVESVSTDMDLAAFNIQIFGRSKMDKPLAVEYLPKIMSNFDIIAVQEIRDSSGEAIEELRTLLPGYELIVSDRLGRTSSKEQYAIFYKDSQVISSEVFPDYDDDFEREPYIVYMKKEGIDFSLIVIHVKPDDAEAEIDKLSDVIGYAQSTNGDDDFMIVGDLNADCSYYDEGLWHLTEYSWVIDDNQDTTVGSNECTYDRIITNMAFSDGGVFKYDSVYNLNQEEAKVISDHYPVWVEI